jgi:Protein of unknown function (DUF1153)
MTKRRKTEELPPPGAAVRWNAYRKLAVVQAIQNGDLTREAALAAYALSPEELASWERLAAHGAAGPRAT